MGGTLPVTLGFLLFFFAQVVFSFSSYWLSIWSGQRLNQSQVRLGRTSYCSRRALVPDYLSPSRHSSSESTAV